MLPVPLNAKRQLGGTSPPQRASAGSMSAPLVELNAPTKQLLRAGNDKLNLFGLPLTRGGAADLWSTLILSCLYLASAVGLVFYNKYLMDYGRFPHPTHLVWVQSVFISIFTALLLFAKPSLFPAAHRTVQGKRVVADPHLILLGVLPVAVLVVMSLVLSNAAYLHSPLVTLQMMKEGGVAFTYLFSLYLAQDSFDWIKVLLLITLLVSTSLTIYGGNAFSIAGFSYQIVAIICESLRISVQTILLNRVGWKLDILTYVLLMMPTCMMLLTGACAAKDIFRLSESFSGPRHFDAIYWSPHLFANGCLAFFVSMAQICLMEHASPILFSVVGIAKSSIVVCLALTIPHESLSAPQGAGFCMQLGLVFAYAMFSSSGAAQSRTNNAVDGGPVMPAAIKRDQPSGRDSLMPSQQTNRSPPFVGRPTQVGHQPSITSISSPQHLAKHVQQMDRQPGSSPSPIVTSNSRPLHQEAPYERHQGRFLSTKSSDSLASSQMLAPERTS